jgi:hypothetical protein
MNRRYHRCKRRCTWYTAWRKLSLHRPSDEPTECFLVAPDEWKRKSSEDGRTGWSDGLSRDTVGLSDAVFEWRQRRAKTSSSAPDELMPWSRGSVGLSVLTINSCIKVRLDLQANKSPGVVKGPFFPLVVNPRYRIRGTNVWCKR